MAYNPRGALRHRTLDIFAGLAVKSNPSAGDSETKSEASVKLDPFEGLIPDSSSPQPVEPAKNQGTPLTKSKLARLLEERKLKEQEAKEKELRKQKALNEKLERERQLYANASHLMQHVQQFVQHNQDSFCDNEKEQTQLKVKYANTLQEISALEKQVETVEKAQEEAAKEEDFETAAQLHEEAQHLQSEINCKFQELLHCASKLCLLEKTKLEIKQQVAEWAQKTQEFAEKYQEKHRTEAKEFASSAEKEYREALERNEQEETQLTLDKEELLAEKKAVEEKFADLNAKAAEKTGTLDEIKVRLSAELSSHQEIVAEITGKLQELQATLKSRREDAQTAKDSIEEIRATFNTELQECDQETYELAAQREEHQQKEASFAQEQAKFKESQLKITTEIEKTQQKLTVFAQTQLLLQEKLESATQIVAEREEIAANAQKFEEERVEKEKQLRRLEKELMTALKAQTQLKELLETLSAKKRELERKVPTLESEKKLAAASKQFKEAARIAAELKDSDREKLELDKTLNEQKTKLQTQVAAVKTLTESIADLKLQLTE